MGDFFDGRSAPFERSRDGLIVVAIFWLVVAALWKLF
jgi:hypothetical protein